jgi:hypothetical protein
LLLLESLQHLQLIHIRDLQVQDQQVRGIGAAQKLHYLPAIPGYLHPIAFSRQFPPQKLPDMTIAIRD